MFIGLRTHGHGVQKATYVYLNFTERINVSKYVGDRNAPLSLTPMGQHEMTATPDRYLGRYGIVFRRMQASSTVQNLSNLHGLVVLPSPPEVHTFAYLYVLAAECNHKEYYHVVKTLNHTRHSHVFSPILPLLSRPPPRSSSLFLLRFRPLHAIVRRGLVEQPRTARGHAKNTRSVCVAEQLEKRRRMMEVSDVPQIYDHTF
jgi:hypothetical protein